MEEKNQTEIKISKYHQVCLSLSQVQETTCPKLANSYTGRLALRTTPQQTAGTCQHPCICPHGAIQSCQVATTSLVRQKGSHDLAKVPQRPGKAIQQSLCQGTLPPPRPRSCQDLYFPLAPKAQAKIAFGYLVSDAKRKK